MKEKKDFKNEDIDITHFNMRMSIQLKRLIQGCKTSFGAERENFKKSQKMKNKFNTAIEYSEEYKVWFIPGVEDPKKMTSKRKVVTDNDKLVEVSRDSKEVWPCTLEKLGFESGDVCLFECQYTKMDNTGWEKWPSSNNFDSKKLTFGSHCLAFGSIREMVSLFNCGRKR
eukprot:UN23288